MYLTWSGIVILIISLQRDCGIEKNTKLPTFGSKCVIPYETNPPKKKHKHELIILTNNRKKILPQYTKTMINISIWN